MIKPTTLDLPRRISQHQGNTKYGDNSIKPISLAKNRQQGGIPEARSNQLHLTCHESAHEEAIRRQRDQTKFTWLATNQPTTRHSGGNTIKPTPLDMPRISQQAKRDRGNMINQLHLTCQESANKEARRQHDQTNFT